MHKTKVYTPVNSNM